MKQMLQGTLIRCWAPHACVDVQSATEKAHDVKKAGEGKKKAAPKKVGAVSTYLHSWLHW